MSEILQHCENFKVAVDEVDFAENLKPCAILQYFQDLATVHATKIGIGYEEMLKKNLFWILSKLSYRVEDYPKIGESINVCTYPEKPKLAEAVRDYYILNSSGKLLISGSSKWCVIDKTSHMIRRCASLFDFNDDEYIGTIPFENANPSLKSFADLEVKEFSILKDKVRLTDLDRNMHMNNARYGDIILNCCSFDYVKHNCIKEFDINFISELKLDEEYEVRYTRKKNEMLCETVKDSDCVVFRARVEWMRND